MAQMNFSLNVCKKGGFVKPDRYTLTLQKSRMPQI